MILLPCPWCGSRNVSEFHHLGEERPRPDPDSTQIARWRAYLHERRNPCGWVTEQWFHRSGCRRYFTVERHTLTNEVRRPADGATTAKRPDDRPPQPPAGIDRGAEP